MDDLPPATGTGEADDAVVGRAFWRSLAVFVLIGGLAGPLLYVMSRPPAPPGFQETELAEVRVRARPAVEVPPVRFTEITSQAGIRFVHENGARGRKLLPETMGGGCAFLDFNNNGHQDLLLVNSDRWPADAEEGAGGEPPTLKLYRNDGEGNFEDVTAGSGLEVSLYGMGVAVGDYDNDGFPDVFISALGTNRLFRNLGNGKFRDVTEEAGVGGDPHEWSTSCGWFDSNGNGRLDLFVCNYLNWSPEYDLSQNFQLTGGGRAYGRPQNFEGTFPYLYRNDGDGRFTEVAEEAGLHVRNPASGVPMAKSLGVTFADLDDDGRIDVIVANDTVQNFLFRNRGDGSFEELGAPSGVAFDMSGSARGAMGIDAARFRNDASIGIAIGNFSNEMTALYVARENSLQFIDEAISTGLGPNTRLELTFGIFFFDYDLDGRLDLFTANGHLEEEINRVQPSQHYEQSPQLFWNCGPEHETEFLPVAQPARLRHRLREAGELPDPGEDFVRPLVGRGAAYADIDGDGDLDILITTAGGTPRLLRNDQQLGRHWVRFRLEGTRCNRDAIGAWVEVDVGERTLRRQVMPTRSYLSQVELPVTFGLGPDRDLGQVRILWPDGSSQTLEDVQVDRMHHVRQEAGEE